MSSSKNILQQLAQKKILPEMPVYESSFSVDSRSWQSTVTIKVNNKSHVITGDPTQKKSEAECSSASYALEFIAKNRTEQIKVSKKNMEDYEMPNFDEDQTFVLIDYENYTKISHLAEMKKDNVHIFRFVGHCNPRAEHSDVDFIINSSIKDAVDHAISYFVGLIVNEFRHSSGGDNLNICILTRDHFGSALSDFSFRNVAIIHCASESKCLDILAGLSV